MRIVAEPNSNVGITTASIAEGQKAGTPLFYKVSGIYTPRPCVVLQEGDNVNTLRFLSMSGSSPSQSTLQSIQQFRNALLTGVGFSAFENFRIDTFDELIEVLNSSVEVDS